MLDRNKAMRSWCEIRKIVRLDYDVFLSANVETMIFPILGKARTIISSFRRFLVDFLAAFN